MLPGASQSRTLISYFSESRYSSDVGATGAFSTSSYPEYIPYSDESVAASTRRCWNAGRPPRTSVSWRMSGVLVQRLPRKYSATGGVVISSRYSASSCFSVRHVK